MSNDITQYAVQYPKNGTWPCYQAGYVYPPNTNDANTICYDPIIVNPQNTGGTAAYNLRCCNELAPVMCCHN